MNNIDAKEIISNSRKQIDIIDEKIIKLIIKRNSLAESIAYAKIDLELNIEDIKREEYIFNKTHKMANEFNINENMLNQIMKILTEMNKQQQKKIMET